MCYLDIKYSNRNFKANRPKSSGSPCGHRSLTHVFRFRPLRNILEILMEKAEAHLRHELQGRA